MYSTQPFAVKKGENDRHATDEGIIILKNLLYCKLNNN